MKKNIIKITIPILCMIIVIAFTGCLKNFDVSRLVEEPVEFEPPEIFEWEEKTHPTEIESEYQGAYIFVTPIFGERIRIHGMEYLAQQIIEAYNDPGRIVDIESSKRGYKNQIEIYNKSDALIGSFEITSDFMLYARVDKNSPLFLMPEYAYYTIEYSLWRVGASLVEPLEDWKREPHDDERATYDKEMLDLRLAHDIKTVLIQKYGISEAYFLNHDIYTALEYASSKLLTVRVYAFIGYAGYSKFQEAIDEDKAENEDNENPILFVPDYHFETPVKMVYTLVDSKYFRMTQYSEPAIYNPELPSSLESRIRAIFPFEHMKKVMNALDDTSNIKLDIHRQALDYLRVSSQGKMEIDD